MQEIEGLKRQGLSIQTISKLTGYDRKTVRKYLIAPDGVRTYRPREARPGKLDPFKPYLNERLQAGVWNACVLMRELRERIIHLDAERLHAQVPRRDFPLKVLLHGLVHHNLYHAGQIALLRKAIGISAAAKD